MSTNTEIANMSLSHLGVGKEISNLETEHSEEANACKAFYPTVRDVVLSDFPWPFTTRSEVLSLVELEPTTEWAYSYRYPSDCMKLRRIFSPLRNDNRQSRVPYLIYNDSSGRLIYTDTEDARIEYSFAEKTEDRYQADFILAFSFLLAVYVAPRLTKGDPFKMGERAQKMYDLHIQAAEQRAINEEQHEEVPASEFERARIDD